MGHICKICKKKDDWLFTTHSFTNFNHRYIHWDPEADNTVILYGQIGSRKFAELHSALKAKASKGLIKYIVRHYLGADPNTKKQTNKLRLSGYGVELQIKSSEYKAQDDRKVNADGQELNAEHNNAGLSKVEFTQRDTRLIYWFIAFKILPSLFPLIFSSKYRPRWNLDCSKYAS